MNGSALVPYPLPVRVELQPDEELHSFVRRNADAMGYQGTAPILRPELSAHHIHVATLTRLAAEPDYQMLSQLLKEEAQTLGAGTVHRWSRSVLSPAEQHVAAPTPLGYPFLSEQMIRRLTLPDLDGRVCPQCLAAPLTYGRVYWILRELVTCPWHGTMLLDTCPTCGAALRMNRRDLACCGACGSDLRNVPVSPAPEALLSGNIWLLHRLGHHALPPLAVVWQQRPWSDIPSWLSLAFVLDLVVFFWKYTDIADGRLSRRPRHNRKRLRPADPTFAEWCDIVAFAYGVLMQWPEGMVHILRNLDDEQLFVPFSRSLQRCQRRNPEHTWLRDAFATYLEQERPRVAWKLTASSWYARPSTPIHQRKMVVLVPQETTSDEWVVDRWLALHILGVPLATIDELVAREVLHPAGFVMTAARTIYWFQRDAITEWLNQIMARVSPAEEPRPSYCIRLGDHEPERIAAVIQAVLVHRLPLWIEEPGPYLSHILALSATMTASILNTELPLADDLSVSDVAAYLGCPPTYIPAMQQRGFFGGAAVQTERPGIPWHEVQRFHTAYQLADEAMRAHGMTLREIQEWQRYLPALIAAQVRVDNGTVPVLRRTVVRVLQQYWSLIPLPNDEPPHAGLVTVLNREEPEACEPDRWHRIVQVQTLVKQLASEKIGVPVALPHHQFVPFLAEERRRRHWDQGKLAWAANLPIESIRALEQCARRAARSSVERLAAALGVPPEYLIYPQTAANGQPSA